MRDIWYFQRLNEVIVNDSFRQELLKILSVLYGSSVPILTETNTNEFSHSYPTEVEEEAEKIREQIILRDSNIIRDIGGGNGYHQNMFIFDNLLDNKKTMKIESGGNIYYPDRVLKISYIENKVFFVDIIIGGKVEEIRFKFDTIEEAEKVRNEIIELADN